MVDRVGEEIRNETLRLGRHDRIRGQCRVVDCTIQIADPRSVTLFCSTFQRCTIDVLKVRTGYRNPWAGCFFDSCTFKGKYYDCYFGEASNFCSLQPGLRGCDFSQATLNLCSYFNCAPEDLQLPRWPHVTIFRPREHADDAADFAGDPLLKWIHVSMGNTSPVVVGITYHLPSYLRQSRSSIRKHWELEKLLAQARSEPPPPEPELSLESMRELMLTKPFVFL